ncbi:hypothetical protein [Novipirellula artificiosorum]|uniref:Uncharacterized protein n=1 Tax=Novipirellula artificiosorum TaxID=2528016 RepID=A0A5C6E048_9BACT|nr:hypothetical protein [Novipirellula artificiosorum]TWU41854.1 hypothetical protein Poly41_01460 [Novipirellula artificiosorum]
MGQTEWNCGDWVIYRKQKSSTSPGQRASNVHPASKGDLYHYTVDKYWIVEKLLDSGEVQLCTRRGKRHRVSSNDPMLRRANWWQRLLNRRRYEAIETTELPANSP